MMNPGKPVGMKKPVQLCMYTRPGCHLCDVARGVLEAVRLRHPFGIEYIDITTDPDIERKYRYEIPVVCIDDRELFRHHVQEKLLEKLVVDETRRG
ncbi:MAG TPA: glutaredoxin family protein [Prosthecochloris aestuarii]|uniref:Glutaredoxin family protein n=1 Tax=Prosthecochloris aestuarii TaxID=1102 RepID=A0A831WVC4_PROAE|nr:glutaredoxin family protein [Prosthecochloris aestuarii]